MRSLFPHPDPGLALALAGLLRFRGLRSRVFMGDGGSHSSGTNIPGPPSISLPHSVTLPWQSFETGRILLTRYLSWSPKSGHLANK
jgi:hypothetical protein